LELGYFWILEELKIALIGELTIFLAIFLVILSLYRYFCFIGNEFTFDLSCTASRGLFLL